MPEITATLFWLFAASFLLGASARRHWRSALSGRETVRWAVAVFGFVLLALSVAGFAGRFGWEVGLAWFLLWFALASLAATIWLSSSPRAAVWMGGVFVAAALGAWAL